MGLDALKERLPEYAKDLKLNLGTVSRSEHLTEQQLWGTLVVSALASRHAEVIRHVVEEASEHLSDDALRAAKAAASIMGMNNIYYRFTHLVSNEEYAKMPARLRMQVIGKPGVDPVDFELWSLAVSAVNGCGMCLDSHEKVLREKDSTSAVVQDAVRAASVVHGVAVTLDGEDALAWGGGA